MTTARRLCARRGCNFYRTVRDLPDGRQRLLPFCSPACGSWQAQAHKARTEGDGEAAIRLLAIVEHLDARESPRQRVPGL
ncbi:hypothetical protein ACFV3F_09465 [Streptomyces sp. NPDC059717]|uniref:hypothetical protein n=1 Tax=Streptomyces sp. NPDC059717 TaxID=3346922 RepID=UPI00368EA618